MYIAIEGIDGAGKTTQAKMLVEWFKKEGLKAAYVPEPDLTTEQGLAIMQSLKVFSGIANKTDSDYMGVIDLWRDYRMEMKGHYEDLLSDGGIIIGDRCWWSTVVNNTGKSQDLIDYVAQSHSDTLKPDIYILLSLSTEMAEKRLNEREDNSNIFSSNKELMAANNVYTELFIAFDGKAIVINAEESKEGAHYLIKSNLGAVCKK